MRKTAVLVGRTIVDEVSLYRLVYALGRREANKVLREIAERPGFIPTIYDVEERTFFSAVKAPGIIEENTVS